MSEYESKPFDPNAPEAPPLCFADLARKHPGRGRPADDDFGVPMNGDWPDWDAFDPERELAAPEAGPFRPDFRPPLGEGGGGPSFSISRFADELRDRLNGNCTGWAFVINQNGQEAVADAGGKAITPGDANGSGTTIGERDMTPDSRINIASVSKTITAVAILRLLDAVGIGTLSQIWPYLPQSWALGQGVEQLRFHNLLTHRSGLTSANNNFGQTLTDQGLQTAIQNGADPTAGYNYLNANFALFRVILPALWRDAGQPAANNGHPVASAFFYAVYVIEELFGRMGGVFGSNASTSPLDAVPTRYYQSATSTQGIDYPNWALWAGGGGWHLTARELAAFMAFITYDDSVLPPAQRAAMDQLRYGWSPVGSNSGAFGDYLGHGGSITAVANGVTGNVRAAIMKFNIQVEASLVVNSALSQPGDSARRTLREAFDAAWS